MTDAPKRKPIRLTEYDYSTPGAYFVTICTQGRRCILSDITAGDGVLDPPCVHLTEYGAAVEQTLQEIGSHYEHIVFEKYVIMPNHIHLLIRIIETGTSGTPSPTDPLVGAGVHDRPNKTTPPHRNGAAVRFFFTSRAGPRRSRSSRRRLSQSGP